MLKNLLVILVTLGVLIGCGQVMVFGRVIGEPRTQAEVKAADPAPPSPPLPSSPIIRRVRAVTLTLNPAATSKAAADPRFNSTALVEAIEAELRSRKLLDTDDPAVGEKAEILVSDFATRSATNAVVFGYHLGSGSLTADIHVGNSAGAGAEKFKVIAETRLAIAANGEDKNPLNPLYRRFAALTADRLAGTPSKPEEQDRDLMPR